MTEDSVHFRDLLRGIAGSVRGPLKTARAVRLLAMRNRSSRASIAGVIERNASKFPDHIALLYGEQRISYREFNERANQVARVLQDRGVRKGEVVAVLVENRPELLICVAAILKLGAVAGMINTSQRGDVLVHSLGLCQTRVFLVGEELVAALDEVRERACTDTSVCLFVPEQDPQQQAPEGTISLASEAASQATDNLGLTGNFELGDPVFYIFTSGTTGMPKASIMSNFRWLKAMAGMGMMALDMGPDDVFYCALPLYHNNALTLSWGAALAGASGFAIARKFSASRFWDDCVAYRATVFCYIGEFCRYLLAKGPVPAERQHRVTRVIGNGLRPDIWNEFRDRYGIERIMEFYGASEGNIAFLNVFNVHNTVGFCPNTYAIVRYDVDEDEPLRDAGGHMIKVETGEVGLLLGEVSDRTPFDGYTDPSAGEKKLFRDVFEKGDCWFNSGDLMRDLGFRHAAFVDRVGDTFRWKGENVSTTEVEQSINRFGGIESTAVYGVQLPGCDGRAGMACIVPELPVEQFDLDGLLEHLNGDLPKYAVPLFLRIREAHDITGTFKLKKTGLKAEGFDLQQVGDPVFVLLPGESSYRALDAALQTEIEAEKYSF